MECRRALFPVLRDRQMGRVGGPTLRRFSAWRDRSLTPYRNALCTTSRMRYIHLHRFEDPLCSRPSRRSRAAVTKEPDPRPHWSGIKIATRRACFRELLSYLELDFAFGLIYALPSRSLDTAQIDRPRDASSVQLISTITKCRACRRNLQRRSPFKDMRRSGTPVPAPVP